MSLDGQMPLQADSVGIAWQGQISNFRSQCGCSQHVDLNAEIGQLLIAAGKLFENIGSLIEKLNSKPPAACQCAPVQPPQVQNSCHPSGSLKVDGNGVITTPGGYKIEQESQFTWKITDKCGHTTEVWGDPHVKEDGKQVFDFKRDSTFVLGDGTRINVSTAPWGSMTVTKQLEIISGNDRVMVNNVDKGKGQVGQVTHDGFDHVNSFGNKDVFVMGQNVAQWSFHGKEIMGSVGGGDSFTLGKDLAPFVDQTNAFGGGMNWASSIFNSISSVLDSVAELENHIGTTHGGHGRGGRIHDKQNKDALSQAMQSIGGIFTTLSQILNLSSRISLGRYNQSLS